MSTPESSDHQFNPEAERDSEHENALPMEYGPESDNKPIALHAQTSNRKQKIPDRPSPLEGIRIWLCKSSPTDWIMAISTVIIMLWAGLQWHEMHGTGRQTDKLIQAAKINAGAAASFSNSAASINTEITNAVNQLGYQVTELRKSAKESNRLAIATEKTAQAAKDGIITNRNAIHLENRAWLGVTNESVVQFNPGQPIKVDVVLINSGKTPASQVTEGMDVQELIMIPNTLLSFGLNGLKPTASIPPQGTHILHFISNDKLDGVTKAKIEEKTLILVIRGMIQYEDFDKTQRSSSICMFMSDPATKQLSFCETGNDMD